MARHPALRRIAWSLSAVSLVTILAFAAHLRAAPARIWTDTPVAVPPSTVAAPNWVALASQLKPAVVNVSTKRVQQDDQGAADPFFQKF